MKIEPKKRFSGLYTPKLDIVENKHAFVVDMLCLKSLSVTIAIYQRWLMHTTCTNLFRIF